jgi:hypothetical protein
MAKTMVYEDAKRTITLSDGGTLTLPIKGQPRHLYAPDLLISETLPHGVEQAIREMGESPERWYTLIDRKNKSPQAVLPPATRPAVALAIATATAEHNRILNDPARVARQKVWALFDKARRFLDDPGRYFPAHIDAKNALNAWRTTYPEAARREDKERLIADAEALESNASGALVYDADGSLSAAEQQRRHDAFIEQAQAKRKEATYLSK